MQVHKSGRKRTRSPGDLPGNDEEPHGKLACLRNIDICKGTEKSKSWTPCHFVPFSPELRMNGNTEHAEEGSFLKICKKNGITQRLSLRFKKGHAKKLLKVHFVLLKKEMEPINVADYLKDHGIVDKSLHDRITKDRLRKDRVDTLIKGVYDLMTEENEDEVFEKFLNALEESRQTYLSEKVKVPPPESYSGKAEKDDEETLLQQFYMKSKEIILKELDAKDIIDKVVVMQGLNFGEHDAILKERRKDKRIELLIKIIDSKGNKARRILRPIYDWYKLKHPEVDMTETLITNDPKCVILSYLSRQKEVAATSSCVTRNVDVKYNFTRTVIEQDANEHTDPHTKLQEWHKSFVEYINGDPDQIQDISRMFDEGCSLKQIKYSSIEFHLQTTNDESLQKLKESCKGEVAKERILRILNKREGAFQKLRELKAKTVTVQLFVYDSRTESKRKHLDEVDLGCLCILNKECVEKNSKKFANTIEGLEMQSIANLLKNKTLPDDLANILEDIKAHAEKQEILQQLVNFLIQKNIPQASFCFLENEVLKVERPECINQLLHENKNSSWNSDNTENKHIPKRSIQEHRELLEEELDALWFYDSLKGRKDQGSKEMIKIIESSSSRRSRTEKFVQYLCELDEDENEWIVDVLKQYNEHILRILRPKAVENVLDFKRGLQSVFDVVTKEMEPEDFTGQLRSSSLDQLSQSTSESDRIVVFLSNLLQTEDVDLFQEVVSAMEASNGDIVSKVRDVLDKRSLSKHYRCPRIEKEVMRRSAFCLSSQFSITEEDVTGLIEDKPAIKAIDLKSKADKQMTKEDSSFSFLVPSETKDQPGPTSFETAVAESSRHVVSPSSSISSMKSPSFCRSDKTIRDDQEICRWSKEKNTKNEMTIIPPLMSLPTTGFSVKSKYSYSPVNMKSINSPPLANTIGNHIKYELDEHRFPYSHRCYGAVPSFSSFMPMSVMPLTRFEFGQKPKYAPCSANNEDSVSVVNAYRQPSYFGNELRQTYHNPRRNRESSVGSRYSSWSVDAAFDTKEFRSPRQMEVYGNCSDNPYTGMSESSLKLIPFKGPCVPLSCGGRPNHRDTFGPASRHLSGSAFDFTDNVPYRQVPKHINEEIQKYPEHKHYNCKSKATQPQQRRKFGCCSACASQQT